MRAIVHAVNRGLLRASVNVCISNNSSSDALAFARENRIPAYHISSKTDQGCLARASGRSGHSVRLHEKTRPGDA